LPYLYWSRTQYQAKIIEQEQRSLLSRNSAEITDANTFLDEVLQVK
jgi:hypothetical protein